MTAPSPSQAAAALAEEIKASQAFHDRACMEHDILPTSHHPDCHLRFLRMIESKLAAQQAALEAAEKALAFLIAEDESRRRADHSALVAHEQPPVPALHGR